jgi:Tfp pilus assembly protein PilO
LLKINAMIKNIWIKYKEYILILIYIVILFTLFYFVIKPMIGRIDYNANLIQEKITVQENFKRKLGMVAASKEQTEAIEKDEGKINVFIPRDQEIDLIEKIEKIAEETDNKISIEAVDDKNIDSSTKAKTVSNKVKEENKDDLKINTNNNDFIKFRITILGKYDNLVSFVKKIENMEYWSDIVSLKVSYKEPEKNPILSENSTDSTGLYEDSEEKTSIVTEEETASSILEAIFYLN